MSSVFVEGRAMYIHGGTTTTTSTPLGQTFSIDLSTNWTTSQPAFKNLTDGFGDYKYASTFLSDNKSWFLLSNQTAHKYATDNDTWSVIGVSGNVNNVKGLAAATDAVSGLVYVVNGWQVNGSVSMQQYNPVSNQINSVPMQPTLLGVNSFAASWSTVRKSLLVHGGATTTTNTLQRGLYEYVPNSGWTLLSDTGDVPPARMSHCMVPAYGGTKMIVFGGIDQTGAVLGDIYALDVATLTWTKGVDGGAIVARGNTVCAITNDLFLAWGGCDSEITALTSSITVVYNMKSNAWQSTYTPTPQPGATTAPSTPSSSTSPLPSPSSPGPIIGGAVGGASLIALAAGFLLYRRKKRNQRNSFVNVSGSSDSEENDGLKANARYNRDSGPIASPDMAGPGQAYHMGDISPLQGSQNLHLPLLPPGSANYTSVPVYAFTGNAHGEIMDHSAALAGAQQVGLKRDQSVYRPNEIINVQGRGPQAITQWEGDDSNLVRNPQSI
ncbi:hypothetical protein BGZ58_009486 [Dissophora ornata]|nr:hypothetical protein BGZ58_009486 [Dissophora ornata]